MVRRNDDIPILVQSQLVALGIPTSKHTCESLTAFFPREFNISAAGLDAENLARGHRVRRAAAAASDD